MLIYYLENEKSIKSVFDVTMFLIMMIVMNKQIWNIPCLIILAILMPPSFSF